jgi:hypothetical protein
MHATEACGIAHLMEIRYELDNFSIAQPYPHVMKIFRHIEPYDFGVFKEIPVI